jgi:hypothetical protein
MKVMKMNEEIQNQTLHQMLIRCWTDPAFKTQLLADPVAVFKAQGLQLAEGLQIRVLEDRPDRVHWVIPARPAALSDADLDAVAGGQSEAHSPAMPNLTLPGIFIFRDRLENIVAAQIRKQQAELLSSLRRIS